MYCMYNNGRMLGVNSVAIDRLLKNGVCSYTDGQVYEYTLKPIRIYNYRKRN